MTETSWLQPRGHRYIHGKKRSPEYDAYYNAKARCQNPLNNAYERYGGRGVEFRFTSFLEFYTELGDKPSAEYSIDRIDSAGHYEKGNVRWLLNSKQSENRSMTIWIEWDGQTRSVADWGRRLGVKEATIYRRVKAGYCTPCSLKSGFTRCPHR